jgi:drug/metabolite transporter (DMT)-like permease
MSETVMEQLRPGVGNSTEARVVRRASLMLVVVTLFWGISFPWTKRWQEATRDCPGGALQASLTLIVLRFPLSMLLLAVWQPAVYCRPGWREHRAGVLLGATFFAGFLPQTLGLAYTTPALSGFFTGLACAWAPLVGWAIFRTPVARLTILGLGVAVAGTAVLVEGGLRLQLGEALTVAASVAFAAQILMLERLRRRYPPAHLTPGFFGATALLALAGSLSVACCGEGLVSWLVWTGETLCRPDVLGNLLLLALLPTALSFHWMNKYQPLVPTSRAALIYLLEPVFSSVFSVILGYDALTVPLVVGGGMILLGNLLVESPGLLSRRPSEPAA